MANWNMEYDVNLIVADGGIVGGIVAVGLAVDIRGLSYGMS